MTEMINNNGVQIYKDKHGVLCSYSLSHDSMIEIRFKSEGELKAFTGKTMTNICFTDLMAHEW